VPRYYFHYRDPNEHLIEDRVGSRHKNLAAAEFEAQILAKEILTEELEEGGSPFAPRCMEIENEAGEVVFYLPFWAAVSHIRRSGRIAPRELINPRLIS